MSDNAIEEFESVTLLFDALGSNHTFCDISLDAKDPLWLAVGVGLHHAAGLNPTVATVGLVDPEIRTVFLAGLDGVFDARFDCCEVSVRNLVGKGFDSAGKLAEVVAVEAFGGLIENQFFGVEVELPDARIGLFEGEAEPGVERRQPLFAAVTFGDIPQ